MRHNLFLPGVDMEGGRSSLPSVWCTPWPLGGGGWGRLHRSPSETFTEGGRAGVGTGRKDAYWPALLAHAQPAFSHYPEAPAQGGTCPGMVPPRVAGPCTSTGGEGNSPQAGLVEAVPQLGFVFPGISSWQQRLAYLLRKMRSVWVIFKTPLRYTGKLLNFEMWHVQKNMT